MAVFLTWMIAVCLPLVVVITGLPDYHLKNSFFTYGQEAQENNPKCHEKIPRDGIAIINKGMEMMYDISLTDGYYSAVESFYKEMEKNLEKAFDKIKQNLGQMFKDTDDLILKGEEKFKNFVFSKKEEKTQALLIFLYTKKSKTDEKSIYYKLNEILRDHSDNCNYKVSENDTYIAPYAAALTATLLHWKDLKTADAITYRGIDRTICEANDPIVWYSFTSSSTSKQQAAEYGTVTTYTIHNNNFDKKLQPKLISEFSDTKEEKEALYPPGSVFIFNNVVHIGNKIAYDIVLKNIEGNNGNCQLENEPIHPYESDIY